MNSTESRNPFNYIKDERCILSFARFLTKLGLSDDEMNSFKEKSIRCCIAAVIGYIFNEYDEDLKNLDNIICFLNDLEAGEKSDDSTVSVDELFSELGAKDHNSFAARQYQKFKLAAASSKDFIISECKRIIEIYKQLDDDTFLNLIAELDG